MLFFYARICNQHGGRNEGQAYFCVVIFRHPLCLQKIKYTSSVSFFKLNVSLHLTRYDFPIHKKLIVKLQMISLYFHNNIGTICLPLVWTGYSLFLFDIVPKMIHLWNYYNQRFIACVRALASFVLPYITKTSVYSNRLCSWRMR